MGLGILRIGLGYNWTVHVGVNHRDILLVRVKLLHRDDLVDLHLFLILVILLLFFLLVVFLLLSSILVSFLVPILVNLDKLRHICIFHRLYFGVELSIDFLVELSTEALIDLEFGDYLHDVFLRGATVGQVAD